MPTTVRVAIIGCGMISHRHMLIYKNINDMAETLGFRAEIAAVAEVDPERLAAFGEQYGIPEKDRYVDYHDMLKRDDIDTVDVCVHNNLHAPVSIEVMKAGFDCYTEKPAAASYADAKLMIDAAKKLGRKFHVQISSVMTPQSRLARKMIRDGRLGKPYYVNLEACAQRRRPGYDWPAFTEDFLSKKVAGHGPSIDLGIYAIGQILFVLDQPEIASVSGFAGKFMPHEPSLVSNPNGFDVEDTADGLIRFTNGAAFHYLATSANNYRDYSMTYILGDKGGLEITDTDMGGYRLARPNPAGPPMFGGEPGLRFFGDMDGRDVGIDLNVDANSTLETRLDPKMWIYNDNQVMWLSYKLGLISEEERYNTPSIALDMLMVTDGIFLSSDLGRSVTRDEIIAMSPSLYLREQEIGGKTYRFDVEV